MHKLVLQSCHDCPNVSLRKASHKGALAICIFHDDRNRTHPMVVSTPTKG
jgi:hypothetical protein